MQCSPWDVSRVHNVRHSDSLLSHGNVINREKYVMTVDTLHGFYANMLAAAATFFLLSPVLFWDAQLIDQCVKNEATDSSKNLSCRSFESSEWLRIKNYPDHQKIPYRNNKKKTVGWSGKKSLGTKKFLWWSSFIWGVSSQRHFCAI